MNGFNGLVFSRVFALPGSIVSAGEQALALGMGGDPITDGVSSGGRSDLAKGGRDPRRDESEFTFNGGKFIFNGGKDAREIMVIYLIMKNQSKFVLLRLSLRFQ